MKISLKITLIGTLLGVGFLTGTAQTHAALLAHDGFDYAAGNVNGREGGTGWSTPWASSTSPASANVVTGTTLEYTGGAISISGSGSALSITGGNDGVLNRTFAGASAGSEIYFSFLFQAVAGSGNKFTHFYLSDDNDRFNSGGIGSPSTNNLNFGARVQQTTDPGTTGVSSISYTFGETYFLVGRLSTDGMTGAAGEIDRVELWVNPTSLTLGNADARADANMGISIADLAVFSTRFVNFADTDQILIDELRIGTSVAAVVPEPSVAGLLILGGIPLLMLRRKRALRHKATLRSA